MFTYLIFSNSGTLIQQGGAQSEDLCPNSDDNSTVIKTDRVYDLSETSTLFLQDGKIIEVHRGVQPATYFVFNYTTKQWEDPRTLDDLKAAQWAKIKAAREAAINAPLETPYGTVDSGPDDRGNITDAVMLLQTMESLGTPITIEFTMFDNTPITLTTAQMVHIGLLLGQKVQAAYVRSQACRAAINAATTKEEVEAVVW